MQCKRLIGLVLILGCLLVCLEGCGKKKKDYNKPLAPGEFGLRKASPEEYPNFAVGVHELMGLEDAIYGSLDYMSKPSSEKFYPMGGITHKRVVDSLNAFLELLDQGLYGQALDEAIRDQFDVYISVGCDDEGTVLFTGYYTPIFDGSLEPTDRFRYPLYNAPDSLVKNELGEILGCRMADGSVEECPSRAEIYDDPSWLEGLELVYLADTFEVYIAHVQGSAYIRQPNGEIITVGYAGTNGHEYNSVGNKLVEEGKIPADQLSLGAMIEYFQAHPDEVDEQTRANPRFVFFQEQSGPPRGSLNVPVTAMRTIATDKTVFPRAALAFVASPLPRQVGSRVIKPENWGYALDQDTGGAIRAAGRCDAYMGKGDEAGNLAGQIYQEGRLFYLFVKE